VLGSVNRGMKSLGNTMRRRGFGYVAALTVMVTFAGAAGMYHFEKDVHTGSGLNDFWTTLWWTAMIITTMGSEYWPKTAEGRALCLLLAVYAFSIFGYFTGVVATFFIGRDAAEHETATINRQDLETLKADMAKLQTLLERRQKHE
jgi:voltage-gated potassium channel